MAKEKEESQTFVSSFYILLWQQHLVVISGSSLADKWVISQIHQAVDVPCIENIFSDNCDKEAHWRKTKVITIELAVGGGGVE